MIDWDLAPGCCDSCESYTGGAEEEEESIDQKSRFVRIACSDGHEAPCELVAILYLDYKTSSSSKDCRDECTDQSAVMCAGVVRGGEYWRPVPTGVHLPGSQRGLQFQGTDGDS